MRAGTCTKAATCRRIVDAATLLMLKLQLISSSTSRGRRSSNRGETEAGDDAGAAENGGGFPLHLMRDGQPRGRERPLCVVSGWRGREERGCECL